MFQSIRNQILVPLVAVQGLAVTTLAVTAATLAARRSEAQVVGRINGVIETLGHSNFPLTGNVLNGMHGLSGAHFAVFGDDGRVLDATLPALRAVPPRVRPARPLNRLESLGQAPTLDLSGTRYLAVPLRTPAGPSLLVLYPETTWRQARWEAAASPLAVGLGTIGLIGLVTTWIAQQISGGLRSVERQVARVAAGDFEGFDPGPSSAEVQDLARSVNQMSAQLREMRQTIRRTERARLLAQLGAGLAHQLRNSLAGARMSVQLHARRFPPPEGDETLNVALRQLALTEEQVKGLLSVGREGVQPHAPCDLGGLLEDVARWVDPSCRHARVRFRLRQGGTPVSVVGDAEGLRAAVLNLTLNAIEAAGTGGEVDLGASDERTGVTIDVEDNGPGPPPEVAETLLEPFVTTKPEGVGLGLAIARQVADEHGGSLGWSREEGRTHFRLSLPRGGEPAR